MKRTGKKCGGYTTSCALPHYNNMIIFILWVLLQILTKISVQVSRVSSGERVQHTADLDDVTSCHNIFCLMDTKLSAVINGARNTKVDQEKSQHCINQNDVFGNGTRGRKNYSRWLKCRVIFFQHLPVELSSNTASCCLSPPLSPPLI